MIIISLLINSHLLQNFILNSIFFLKNQGGCFNPPYEGGISPFDDIVDVHWPIPKGVPPNLSVKDIDAPCLTLAPRFSVSVQSKRKRFLIVGASGQGGLIFHF